jgi:hypothetical protein
MSLWESSNTLFKTLPNLLCQLTHLNLGAYHLRLAFTVWEWLVQ